MTTSEQLSEQEIQEVRDYFPCDIEECGCTGSICHHALDRLAYLESRYAEAVRLLRPLAAFAPACAEINRTGDTIFALNKTELRLSDAQAADAFLAGEPHE